MSMFILTETDSGKYLGASETFENVMQMALNTHRWDRPTVSFGPDWHFSYAPSTTVPTWTINVDWSEYETEEDRKDDIGTPASTGLTVRKV